MDKLLTVLQIAKRLSVCEHTIYRYIKAGKLKIIKLTPRNFRIAEKDLNQFLKKHKSK
jgi:excisionase family DNA binding protein